MEPKTLGEHQRLLTEVIKKQIVILGPDITLAKARNVAGLVVADDGTVTAINGDPQTLTRELVNQFMELSGLIVKKTMEPLLSMSSDTPLPMPAIPTISPLPAATSTPTNPPSAPITPPQPEIPVAQPPLAPSTENMQQSKEETTTSV